MVGDACERRWWLAPKQESQVDKNEALNKTLAFTLKRIFKKDEKKTNNRKGKQERKRRGG